MEESPLPIHPWTEIESIRRVAVPSIVPMHVITFSRASASPWPDDLMVQTHHAAMQPNIPAIQIFYIPPASALTLPSSSTRCQRSRPSCSTITGSAPSASSGLGALILAPLPDRRCARRKEVVFAAFVDMAPVQPRWLSGR